MVLHIPSTVMKANISSDAPSQSVVPPTPDTSGALAPLSSSSSQGVGYSDGEPMQTVGCHPSSHPAYFLSASHQKEGERTEAQSFPNYVGRPRAVTPGECFREPFEDLHTYSGLSRALDPFVFGYDGNEEEGKRRRRSGEDVAHSGHARAFPEQNARASINTVRMLQEDVSRHVLGSAPFAAFPSAMRAHRLSTTTQGLLNKENNHPRSCSFAESVFSMPLSQNVRRNPRKEIAPTRAFFAGPSKAVPTSSSSSSPVPSSSVPSSLHPYGNSRSPSEVPPNISKEERRVTSAPSETLPSLPLSPTLAPTSANLPPFPTGHGAPQHQGENKPVLTPSPTRPSLSRTGKPPYESSFLPPSPLLSSSSTLGQRSGEKGRFSSFSPRDYPYQNSQKKPQKQIFCEQDKYFPLTLEAGEGGKKKVDGPVAPLSKDFSSSFTSIPYPSSPHRSTSYLGRTTRDDNADKGEIVSHGYGLLSAPRSTSRERLLLHNSSTCQRVPSKINYLEHSQEKEAQRGRCSSFVPRPSPYQYYYRHQKEQVAPEPSTPQQDGRRRSLLSSVSQKQLLSSIPIPSPPRREAVPSPPPLKEKLIPSQPSVAQTQLVSLPSPPPLEQPLVDAPLLGMDKVTEAREDSLVSSLHCATTSTASRSAITTTETARARHADRGTKELTLPQKSKEQLSALPLEKRAKEGEIQDTRRTDSVKPGEPISASRDKESRKASKEDRTSKLKKEEKVEETVTKVTPKNDDHERVQKGDVAPRSPPPFCGKVQMKSPRGAILSSLDICTSGETRVSPQKGRIEERNMETMQASSPSSSAIEVVRSSSPTLATSSHSTEVGEKKEKLQLLSPRILSLPTLTSTIDNSHCHDPEGNKKAEEPKEVNGQEKGSQLEGYPENTIQRQKEWRKADEDDKKDISAKVSPQKKAPAFSTVSSVPSRNPESPSLSCSSRRHLSSSNLHLEPSEKKDNLNVLRKDGVATEGKLTREETRITTPVTTRRRGSCRRRRSSLYKNKLRGPVELPEGAYKYGCPVLGDRFADLGPCSRTGVRRVFCYHFYGLPRDPALVLISGLGSSSRLWPRDFCIQLASTGLFVVCFDNRDIGLTTHWDGFPAPSLTKSVFQSIFRSFLGKGHSLNVPRTDSPCSSSLPVSHQPLSSRSMTSGKSIASLVQQDSSCSLNTALTPALPTAYGDKHSPFSTSRSDRCGGSSTPDSAAAGKWNFDDNEAVHKNNPDGGTSTHTSRSRSGSRNRTNSAKSRKKVEYILIDMAQDTLDLMTYLGITTAHFLGTSMGGMIAQDVALLAPERVKSLSLLSTHCPGCREEKPNLKLLVSSFLDAPEENTMEEIVEYYIRRRKDLIGDYYNADTPKAREMFRASVTRSPGDKKASQRQFNAMQQEPSRVKAIQALHTEATDSSTPFSLPSPFFAALNSPSLTSSCSSALESLPGSHQNAETSLLPSSSFLFPVVVIHGNKDRMVPVSNAYALHRLWTFSDLHILEHMGHNIPDELFSSIIEIVSQAVNKGEDWVEQLRKRNME